MAMLCFLAAWPLASCLFESSGNGKRSPGAAHRLDYRVALSETGRTCRVEIALLAWPETEPRIFQAPVFYADNPVMPAPGYRAADLAVRDASGHPLAARDTVIDGISLDGNFIVLPPSARSLSYAVDLAPRDSARFGLPTPGTAAGVDLVEGAYYFILPLVGRDYPSQWRTPVDLTLEFGPTAGRVLVGSDTLRTLGTNYELMFVRGAIDPVRTLTLPIGSHEVTVYTTSDSALDLSAFGTLLGKCISAVEDSLLPLPTSRYFAGENSQFWGIEGVQGYWFKAEAREMAEVHVHELVHTFVGVYHSDYQDPWWKEGVTNYIGLLLSLQRGLIGDTAFAGDMLTVRDTIPSAKEYGLSSPYIRNHLFTVMDSAFVEPADPERFTDLVYGKGSQAAMILDRYILERTGGKRSLYDLVRDVVRSYGSAFHRVDLAASLDRVAGGSSSAFLADLLDHPTPLGADSLAHTYAVLRSLGRFAPGGGKAPINGVDPGPVAAGKASAGDGRAPASRVSGAIPPGAKL